MSEAQEDQGLPYRHRKPRVKKYVKGDAINMQELVVMLSLNAYVFWHDRPCHAGWLRSMQYNCLEAMCRRKELFLAHLNHEWHPPGESEND